MDEFPDLLKSQGKESNYKKDVKMKKDVQKNPTKTEINSYTFTKTS